MSLLKSSLIFLSCLFFVLICFYGTYLFGAESFFFRDTTLYFEPLCRYIAYGLKQGYFPLWNTFTYCGMPQIGIASPSMFYPPNWLLAVFSFNQTIAANMILSHLAAGIGGFLIVTSFGWGWIAAAFAGCILALSGYMFSLTSNYTIAAGAAWFLLSLACLKMIGNKKHFYWIVASSLSIFLLIAAGRPEIFAPGIFIIVAYIFLDRFFTKDNKQNSNQIFYWRIRAIAVGILLSAPIIIPAIEWLGLSRRQSGLVPEEALLFSANWYDLLCFIIPQPFGDLSLHGNKFLPLVSNSGLVPFIGSAFIGPVAFTYVMIGLSDSSWRHRLWWFIGLCAALILILGSNTVIIPSIFNICPGLSLLRFPIKYSFFVIFCLSIFAARGMYLVINKKEPDKIGRSLLLSSIFWTIIFAFSVLSFYFSSLFASIFRQQMGLPFGLADKLILNGQEAIAYSSIAAAVIGILTCGLLYWAIKQPAKTKFCILAIYALLIACFNYLAYGFCHQSCEVDFFTKDQHGKKQIGSQEKSNFRTTGLYLELVTCPHWYITNSKMKPTAAWYQYVRDILLPNTNMDARIPSAFGYEAAMTGDYYNWFLNSYFASHLSVPQATENKAEQTDLPLHRLCQVTATKYVMTQIFRFSRNMVKTAPLPVPMLDSKYFSLVQEDKFMNLRIYEVLNCLPRTNFVQNIYSLEKHDDVLNTLLSKEEPAFDPTNVVMLEGYTGKTHLGERNYSPSISFTEDSSEDIKLKVSTEKAGFLVLSDLMYPGWQCRVDNTPQKIYRANGFFRAVYLDAGTHSVCFEYRPGSLYIGMVLALIGVFWLTYLFKNRRSLTVE